MKKIAFFVEGLTEQIFLKKLLEEIAGVKHISISEQKLFTSNGKAGHYKILAESKITGAKYFALINDVGGDSKVQSELLDNYHSLVKRGYTTILGLKDVYPHNYSDISKLEKAAKFGLPTKPVLAMTIFAVMEVEAWFIAECSHFQKIDISLTPQKIKHDFSIDILNDDLQQINNPAEKLHKIYSSVGKKYYLVKSKNKKIKKKKRIQKTVDSIDYANLYVTVPNKFPYFKELIRQIDTFLS